MPEAIEVAALADTKMPRRQRRSLLACFGTPAASQLRVENGVGTLIRYCGLKLQGEARQFARAVMARCVAAVFIGLDPEGGQNFPDKGRRVFLKPVRWNRHSTDGANDKTAALDADFIATA
ncbi:hypothetical protein D3C78_1578460 [compost metagenome]